MKILLNRLLLALCLFPAAWPAIAQNASAPGEVRVAVSDDSAAARSAAIETGVVRMITRLTGDPAVGDSLIGQRLQEQADRFVEGFSYRRLETESETETEDAADAQRLELALQLDEPALREALVRAGVRVWPSELPTVLVWLALERDGERQLLDASAAAALAPGLRSLAAERGIRVFFPLLDLADRQTLTYVDVAAGFTEPIREASKRYNADLVLAGRLQRDATGYVRSRWIGLGEEVSRGRWQAAGPSVEAVVEDMVPRIARRLRRVYAFLPDLDARRRLEVEVRGVTDLSALDALQRRLGAIAGVQRARVTRVAADRVTLSLALQVDSERVLAALADDPRLAESGSGWRWQP
ncbi:UNVERIFIED_CONTAM: DUF2066 domain-containing protein [Spiribacter pallidus]